MKGRFFVYELWGAGDQCLYVGFTANLPSRLRDHIGQSGYAADVTDIQVVVYPTKREALDAEHDLIFRLQPMHNSASRTQPHIRALS